MKVSTDVGRGVGKQDSGAWEGKDGADAVTGHLDGVDEEGRLLFRIEGQDRTETVAIGVDLPDDVLVKAARVGQRALVIRTNEPKPRLVLLGLVRERVKSSAREAELGAIEAKVDGDTVQISAEKGIELRCGKARITLHKDGRIEVSGTYLLSRSRGPVKLKGATVEIN